MCEIALIWIPHDLTHWWSVNIVSGKSFGASVKMPYLNKIWKASREWIRALFQYKDHFATYVDNHYKVKRDVRLSCLVHPAVRDKRRVSEIDLSQPRHETAFWWRHNGPVTSQLTDPIKWRNYPFELMFKCAYINTHIKESMTQRYCISTNVQLCLIFLYISIWFES